MSESSNDAGLLNHLSWWGVPTFFRCEHDPALSDLEIRLVGIPHSSGNGSTERDQHLGPRAVRLTSTGYRRLHREFRISP